MHRVLARQLRRQSLSVDATPSDLESWKGFLRRVEDHYVDSDDGRYLLERSLRLSSDELNQSNSALRELALARIERTEARYRDLFQLSRVATWEEDFQPTLKHLEALRAEGVTDLEAYLLDNPDVLTEIITQVVVTAVNPAVGRLVGSEDDLESLLGPVPPELVNERNTPAWIAELNAIWEGTGSVRIDQLVGTRHNGDKFYGILEWHAPRVGDHYDYSRVVVTIIDITERIEAEERMQEVLQSKDEFLASISHELRTPLTSVLGFAEVLKEMGEESGPEERESLLEIIASQAVDLSDIVEDLLVAARAELGQLSVVSVPVDIHAQIAQTLEAAQGIVKPVSVPERPADRVVVTGDPQRVRQILRNLITNAARYGGEQVKVEVEDGSGDVWVRILDDGGGLDAVSAGKVFERYYRSRPDEGQPGSVGIGLTISRELARMMGGDLFYERRDDWTVFAVRLPRHQPV